MRHSPSLCDRTICGHHVNGYLSPPTDRQPSSLRMRLIQSIVRTCVSDSTFALTSPPIDLFNAAVTTFERFGKPQRVFVCWCATENNAEFVVRPRLSHVRGVPRLSLFKLSCSASDKRSLVFVIEAHLRNWIIEPRLVFWTLPLSFILL